MCRSLARGPETRSRGRAAMDSDAASAHAGQQHVELLPTPPLAKAAAAEPAGSPRAAMGAPRAKEEDGDGGAAPRRSLWAEVGMRTAWPSLIAAIVSLGVTVAVQRASRGASARSCARAGVPRTRRRLLRCESVSARHV